VLIIWRGEEKKTCDCPKLNSHFILREAWNLFLILIGKIWLMSRRKTNKNQEEVYIASTP